MYLSSISIPLDSLRAPLIISCPTEPYNLPVWAESIGIFIVRSWIDSNIFFKSSILAILSFSATILIFSTCFKFSLFAKTAML